jgi:hypothetical protein
VAGGAKEWRNFFDFNIVEISNGEKKIYERRDNKRERYVTIPPQQYPT